MFRFFTSLVTQNIQKNHFEIYQSNYFFNYAYSEIIHDMKSAKRSPFILFLEAEPLPVAVCAFLDDAFVLESGADCTDDC